MTDSGQPPLGLIAGEGIFPFLVAQGARAAGRRVVCAALLRCASPDLKDLCDSFHWVGVLRLNSWIRVLRAGGCSQAIIVGRVPKAKLHTYRKWIESIPDLRTMKMYFNHLRRDKRDQSVFLGVAGELAKKGITLIDTTQYCADHLCAPGVLTRKQPTKKQWDDIRFGWPICKTITQLDIGQAIAVLDANVLAVEAIEGTNAMIERVAGLTRHGGWTLIKVSNRAGDMRFDVPTVGVTTIEKLHQARAGCLVLEPAKTILLEKPKVLETADKMGIAVVGYSPPVSV